MNGVLVDPVRLGDLAHWPAWVQASALAVLTLVSEDAVTLGAGWLAGQGRLDWPAAFAGTALGIWAGDALLYLAARWAGRRVFTLGWFRRRLNEDQVAHAEEWFATRGAWALVLSRLIPGTRLPTYLAAGVLRMPFPLFAGITGSAALAWTLAIFLLVTGLEASLKPWTGSGLAYAAWPSLALGFVVIVAAGRIARSRSASPVRLGTRMAARLDRWRRWEFWPAWLFYAPVALYYLTLALRHRSLTLPTAANPGIRHGGVVGESKLATLRDLHHQSPAFTAPTWDIPIGGLAERLAAFDHRMADAGLGYPVILKPDLGQRGCGVRVVRSRTEAAAALAANPALLVLQAYAPGPGEAGIFYHRAPGAPHGRIVSITEKIFPAVVGDGLHSVEELIRRDPRARCLADCYLRRHAARRLEVLPPGATLRLVEAGNHAQGCIFRDGRALWSPALEARIDEIARGLEGFFIGRFDLRYSTPEALRRGDAFTIVELNGAGAEDTSIYDERRSLRDAYGALFRQWRLVFETGAANRRLGTKPTPVGEFCRVWRQAARQFAVAPPAD